jgi:tetratricopeptide (TPR) repeat protein
MRSGSAWLCLTVFMLGFVGAAVGQEAEKRILVVPFRAAGDRSDLPGYAVLLTEIVTAELSTRQGVAVVEREELGKALAEAELSLMGVTDPADAIRLGKLTTGEYVLLGTLQAVDGNAEAEIRMVHIATTDVVKTASVRGLLEETPALGSELAEDLVKDWGDQPGEREREVDPHPEATLHLLRGLSHYHMGQYDKAIAELIDALRGARGVAVARFYMAEAYSRQERYNHAWIEYRRFLREYPQHALAPEAQSGIALAEGKAPEVKAFFKIED